MKIATNTKLSTKRKWPNHFQQLTVIMALNKNLDTDP